MTFSLIAGTVQLTVPAYAFRLVRRFGTKNIGWLVVLTFACLALLHVFNPLRPVAAGPFSGVMPDTIYVVGSLLLLVGLAHGETLVRERGQASSNADRMLTDCETRFQERTADLVKTNEHLRAEVARCEKNQKAAQESEAQYRFLFGQNPLPMCIFDHRSCRFLAVNDAAIRQYGFTEQEFLAMTARDLVPASAASAFLEDSSKPCAGAERRGLWQHIRKDRTMIDVEITAVDFKYGNCSARLMLASDVTEQRRREAGSRQLQRMEAVGHVAAGVAHHFNNILTIIAGQVSLLEEKPQDPISAARLEQVSAAVTRAAGVNQQLLAAGGRQRLRIEPLALNALIQKLSPTLVGHPVGQIVLQTNLDPNLSPVLADRQLVEQIMANLALNAREAMADRGTLTLSTKAVDISEMQAQLQVLKPGPYVCLKIGDTGCGMKPEAQAHLFEPFFTTKNTGTTVGLGMAGVYGAVRQMSGWIEFTSEVGVGTEFRIYLPCSTDAPDLTKTGASAATASVKGTILLVLSDSRARDLARCALDWNNYRVIEADSGSTALLLWQGQASKVDLLLTDSNFPDGATGQALLEQLRQSRPQLKALFVLDPRAKSGDQPGCIRQPLRPPALLQAVQNCLTAAQA
ncbi:MAG: hypothetical protein C5B50_23040 [Verrucomicrobia bacterium]|nr:MAG: hypothetical protein C5B50_23040 [Verrucomicrobiota bacterium]